MFSFIIFVNIVTNTNIISYKRMSSRGIFVKINSLQHFRLIKYNFITTAAINTETVVLANCLTSETQLREANLLEEMK